MSEPSRDYSDLIDAGPRVTVPVNVTRRQPPAAQVFPLAGGEAPEDYTALIDEDPEKAAFMQAHDPFTGENLQRAGAAVLKYGGPVALGIGTSLVNPPAGLTAGGKAAFPVVADLLTQLGYTKGLQLLGIERQGAEPLEDVADATLKGHAIGMLLPPLLRQMLLRTRAGRQWLAERRAQGLAGQAFQAKTEADELAQRTGEAVTLAKQRQQAQGYALDDALTNAQEAVTAGKETRRAVPAANARAVTQYVGGIEAPLAEQVKALFAQQQARSQGQQIPLEVFTEWAGVRKEIAQEHAALARIAPEMANARVGAMGKPTEVTRMVDAAAEAEKAASAAQHMGIPLSRPAGQALKDTPDAFLELQDFLRKASPQSGKWGLAIDPTDKEWTALLTKKEAGAAGRRLLNKNGFTPQEMAERLQEAGFLKEANVEDMKRVLDDSLAGRPQLSAYRDFFDFQPMLDQASAAFAERPTMTAFHDLLKSYSQAIATTRAAVERQQSGAATELIALTRQYGALQRGFDAAIERGDFPESIAAGLRAANAAHRTRAIVDDLGGLIQRKIGYTPDGGERVLRLGALMNELEKPSNQDLVQGLVDIGAWDGLKRVVDASRTRITDQTTRIREAEAIVKELQQTVKMTKRDAAMVLESLTEETAPRLEAFTAEARRAQASAERLRSSIPQERGPWGFASGVGVSGAVAAGAYLGGPLGATVGGMLGLGAKGTEYWITYYLRSPEGQDLLGRIVAVRGETLPAPLVRVMTQAARVTQQHAADRAREREAREAQEARE